MAPLTPVIASKILKTAVVPAARAAKANGMATYFLNNPGLRRGRTRIFVKYFGQFAIMRRLLVPALFDIRPLSHAERSRFFRLLFKLTHFQTAE